MDSGLAALRRSLPRSALCGLPWPRARAFAARPRDHPGLRLAQERGPKDERILWPWLGTILRENAAAVLRRRWASTVVQVNKKYIIFGSNDQKLRFIGH